MFDEIFPITSRYYGIEIVTMKMSDGKTVAYLRRRFLPNADRFAVIQEHTVVEGDRLDNIAAQYLGDPLQFWRVADANSAMRPQELTAIIGRRLLITQPEGIPGFSNA